MNEWACAQYTVHLFLATVLLLLWKLKKNEIKCEFKAVLQLLNDLVNGTLSLCVRLWTQSYSPEFSMQDHTWF